VPKKASATGRQGEQSKMLVHPQLRSRTLSRATEMKRGPHGSKTGNKAARGQKAVEHGVRSTRTANRGRQGGDLEKALSLIRTHPGIRPSELNRLLNREESDGLRQTLIKRGLIRKERDGSAMRYYPV
jgi:hypothetical protein